MEKLIEVLSQAISKYVFECMYVYIDILMQNKRETPFSRVRQFFLLNMLKAFRIS